jgi:hypothetical protein
MSAYELMKATAAIGFQRRFGCDTETAGLAASALHPLDGTHPPMDRMVWE